MMNKIIVLIYFCALKSIYCDVKIFCSPHNVNEQENVRFQLWCKVSSKYGRVKISENKLMIIKARPSVNVNFNWTEYGPSNGASHVTYDEVISRSVAVKNVTSLATVAVTQQSHLFETNVKFMFIS